MYHLWYISCMEKAPAKKITVHFYKSALGNEPVRDWLKSLDKEDMKTIGEDIKTVEFGWPLGMPLVRKMSDKLWEVRSDISDNRIARVLFTVKGGIMYLLHGFIKKQQKTPAADLKKAEDRK